MNLKPTGTITTGRCPLPLPPGDILDIMKVTILDEAAGLYENDLIADLTESYESHASDYLKGIYDSYGGRALENVTFDGKIIGASGHQCGLRSQYCLDQKRLDGFSGHHN